MIQKTQMTRAKRSGRTTKGEKTRGEFNNLRVRQAFDRLLRNFTKYTRDRVPAYTGYWHCRRPATYVVLLPSFYRIPDPTVYSLWESCQLKLEHPSIKQICSEESSSTERYSKESCVAELQSNKSIILMVEAKMVKLDDDSLLLNQNRLLSNRPIMKD